MTSASHNAIQVSMPLSLNIISVSPPKFFACMRSMYLKRPYTARGIVAIRYMLPVRKVYRV